MVAVWACWLRVSVWLAGWNDRFKLGRAEWRRLEGFTRIRTTMLGGESRFDQIEHICHDLIPFHSSVKPNVLAYESSTDWGCYLIIIIHTKPASTHPSRALVISLSMHLVILRHHTVGQRPSQSHAKPTYRPICLKYHSLPVRSDIAKNGPCFPSRVYSAIPLLSRESDPSSENGTCHNMRSFRNWTLKIPLFDKIDTASSPGMSAVSHGLSRDEQRTQMRDVSVVEELPGVQIFQPALA